VNAEEVPERPSPFPSFLRQRRNCAPDHLKG